MRKWMKGIVIAGVTLLFIGTAITALAAAVGNVQEKSYNSLAGYHFNFGVMKSIGNALRPGRVQIRDYDSDLEPEEDWDYSDEFNISEKNEMMLVGSYTNIAKIEIEAERAAVKIVENPELTNEIRVYMKEDRYARIKTENDGPNELSVVIIFLQRLVMVRQNYRLYRGNRGNSFRIPVPGSGAEGKSRIYGGRSHQRR